MASASAATVQPASVVGNAFVSQYYNVLHQSPHVVHRFYTDESKLTRAGGPNATVDTVTTQQDIHNKVMSLDHANFKAEIKTVDSQDSLKGGVLVMVTGSLSNKASGKRNFVQTFFLAPQEKGYFVLNDVLRYLDDESEVVVNHGGYAMANGITEPVSSVPETEPSRGDSITSDEGYVLAEREEEPEQAEPAVPVAHVAAPVVEESAVPAAPTPAEAPAAAAAAAAEVSHGEAPKKSYASIVLAMKEHGGPIVPIRAAPLKHTPTSSPAPALPAKVAAPSPSHEVAADEHHPASDSEADKRSIFVKNLPLNVTESQLDAEFKKFGPIKAGGGVQIRTFKGPQQQQGYCYAFIEFEDQQSAQNAVEGTNVQISGRTVYVESRKTPTGGRGRGREGRGEGRGRGRGDYAGGRGEYSREGRGDYGSGRGGGRGGYGREGGNYGRGEGGRYASTNTNNVGGGNHAASNAEANATSDDGFRQRPQRRSSNRNGGRHAAAPAVVAAE